VRAFGLAARLRGDYHQHFHDTRKACAIVSTLIALVEGQHVDLAAALFRSIWGAEPGRLRYLNCPSFYGEIFCCWRPRWIAGSQGSPMLAYTWYVWRKTPRISSSLKVRIGKHELVEVLDDQVAGRRSHSNDRGLRQLKTSRRKIELHS
jgi:hypothetical protein